MEQMKSCLESCAFKFGSFQSAGWQERFHPSHRSVIISSPCWRKATTAVICNLCCPIVWGDLEPYWNDLPLVPA
jgi:hypothetical protein